MLLAPLFTFALVAVGIVAAASGRAPKGPSGPRLGWEPYRALCSVWARAWGVPVLVLLVVGVVESGMRPGMTDASERAMKRGGAFGLFGLTGDTARSLFARSAELRHVVGRRWNGQESRGLLDPTVNAAVAAFYLALLWHKFGRVMPTIAAYQQGPVTVAHVLERGGDLSADLPPHGRDYVSRAAAVIRELATSEAAS